MAHDPPIVEPPEFPPPPLPARSPLRDHPYYKSKRRLSPATSNDKCIAPASPASQEILNELHRELKDTQQRLVSAIYEGGKIHSLGASISPKGGMLEAADRRLSERSVDDECTAMDFLMSEAESEANSSDDLSISGMRWSKTSSGYRQPIKEIREEKTSSGDEDWERRATLGGGHNDEATESNTTISSYNGQCPPSSPYSAEEDEDARAEAWLARGLPTSPVIRPAHPVSPLNNGRDAYGNHIPSSPRNVPLVQSPPTSPTLHHPPQDQHTRDQERQEPQVNLRGGWELPQPFWKRGGHGELSQEQGAPNEQGRNIRRSVDGTGGRQRLPSQTVPGPRSQDATDLRTNLANRNIKVLKSATTNERFDKADRRGVHGTKAPASHQLQPSDPPNENPYDNLSFIFNKHFGIPICPPIPKPSGTRPILIDNPRDNSSGHGTVATRNGLHFPPPPIDATPNMTKALQVLGYPVYRPMSPLYREDRSNSPETQTSATTFQSHNGAPREDKRWNRELPRTPPKEPAPRLSEEVDSYFADHMSFQDDESIFSARTADDRLKGLVELQTSGPYKKAKQARAARRILEEQGRHRQQAEREGDTDLHTITPSMSVSQRQMRRPPPRRETQRPGLGRVPENESYHLSERNVPRQNTYEQVISQYPHSGAATTAVFPAPTLAPTAIEPARNDKPNMNSMEMAFHLAGKVTRFLLAAPSDPKLKTYSKRYPPTDIQQRVNAATRTNTSGPERISTSAPSQPQGPRVPRKDTKHTSHTQDKSKGKGKEKATDLGATTDRQDFAPRVTHDSRFSGTTAVNSQPRYTGNTLKVPTTPRFTTGDPELAPGRLKAEVQYAPSDTGTTWPEQDEQGDVIVSPRQPGMRGGGGNGNSGADEIEYGNVRSSFSTGSSVTDMTKEKMEKNGGKRKKKEKKKSAWGNSEYAMALHSMG